MSTNDGGPAFPVGLAATTNANGDPILYDSSERMASGISKRDYFAAKANIAPDMPTIFQAIGVMGEEPPSWPPFRETLDFEQCLRCVKWWAEAESRIRYVYADAMLKAGAAE